MTRYKRVTQSHHRPQEDQRGQRPLLAQSGGTAERIREAKQNQMAAVKTRWVAGVTGLLDWFRGLWRREGRPTDRKAPPAIRYSYSGPGRKRERTIYPAAQWKRIQKDRRRRKARTLHLQKIRGR